jgi:SAM-dependent methyltransferase
MAWRIPSSRALRRAQAAAERAALEANLATYSHLGEREYVNGAPHLKHASIGAIHRALVFDAIWAVGRDPDEISVLDLGAGNGLGSIPWFRRRVRLTAVDSSEAMMDQLRKRASRFGLQPRTVVADVFDYLASTQATFDVVTHVSMLHHIPDYLELLRHSAAHVRPGGALLTFQDPLRYDEMPAPHRVADRASYFAWRLGQGNYKRGLKTRWRRLRGVYSTTEAVDFDEYHVVRNGVDSQAIAAQLSQDFAAVKVIPYWSTYSAPLQWLGEQAGLASSFAILATGRQPIAREEVIPMTAQAE